MVDIVYFVVVLGCGIDVLVVIFIVILLFMFGMYVFILKVEWLNEVVVLKLIDCVLVIGCLFCLFNIVFKMIGFVIFLMVKLFVILYLFVLIVCIFVFLKVMVGYFVVLKKLVVCKCLFKVFMLVFKLDKGIVIFIDEFVGFVLLILIIFWMLLKFVDGVEKLKWFYVKIVVVCVGLIWYVIGFVIVNVVVVVMVKLIVKVLKFMFLFYIGILFSL